MNLLNSVANISCRVGFGLAFMLANSVAASAQLSAQVSAEVSAEVSAQTLAEMTARVKTSSCRIADYPQEVQCGQIQRPLDPAQPAGKKITVHFVVVPSQDKNKLSDAVFVLAGGPGQSAINAAAWGQTVLGRLNRRRDLVFVDQRGTGQSAPLQCPELENGGDLADTNGTVKLALACMKKLQALPYGDLRFFSTSIAVQDLEAVRLSQAYGKINLVGASYGTRVGLEFLRQYPQSVRRLVIDGVVPPDMRLPAADAQKALDGVFADCAKDARCNKAYPDLAACWKKLLASLPQSVTVIHPRLGNKIPVTISRDTLLSLVHKTLYAPTSAAALPYALTQAEQTNYAPLITLSGALGLPSPLGIAYGMHFSVWCGEAYAHPILKPASDDFEKLMDGMYGAVCANWPHAVIPPAFYTIPVSPAPVLLLSGGIDPVTPTRHGDSVAKALGANARHITIDNAGHGLLSQGCVRDVVYRYFNAKEDQDAIKVDAKCVHQIPRPLAWQAPAITLPTTPMPETVAPQGAKP
ncbi:pimeloyl-ACP methyl ester carboxylesterase [Undibacterium sp. GrIS 1.8]|uniref:alpha/beta hydrolase n=1 Tax=unclassified Undibacterium TaxID=2630295 RepID=UPI003392C94D